MLALLEYARSASACVGLSEDDECAAQRLICELEPALKRLDAAELTPVGPLRVRNRITTAARLSTTREIVKCCQHLAMVSAVGIEPTTL